MAEGLKQIKADVKTALAAEDWPRGVELMKKWVGLRSEDPKGWYYRAYFLLKMDRPREANACVKKALDLAPDSPEASKLKKLIRRRVKDLNKQEEVTSTGLWQIGQLVQGRYEVKGSKKGGMGEVYFAFDYELDHMVAIKAPLPSLLETESKKARFFREAEAWMGLGMHPNICCAYYVQEMSGIPWLFIEYVDGGTLTEWLKGRSPTFEDRLDIAIQIASGLKHTHTFLWRDNDGNTHRGLVHRDLKPANILMAMDGTAKVTDFGLVGLASEPSTPSTPSTDAQPESFEPLEKGWAAETVDWEITADVNWQTITATRGALGTPPYMAPEQWATPHAVSFPADIYAFGCILYDIFCQRRPFRLPVEHRHAMPAHKMYLWEKMHREGVPPDPRAMVSGLHDDLAGLMLQCLEKKTDNRPEEFDEIVDRLKFVYKATSRSVYPRPEPRASRLVSDSLNNQGVSYITIGQTRRATAAWREALKADPHHIEATFNMAMHEWESNVISYEEVFRRMEEVGRTHTTAWRHQQLTGRVYLSFGDYTKAVTYLQQALKVNTSVTVLKDLGLALCAESAGFAGTARWEEAERCFLSVINHGYEDAEVVTGRALAMMRMEREEDARRFYRREAKRIKELPVSLMEAIHRFLPGQEVIGDITHSGWLTYLGFTPDGRSAICGSESKVSRWAIRRSEDIDKNDSPSSLKGGGTAVWDIKPARLFEEVFLRGGTVMCMVMSPDGRYLITGGANGDVRLWDPATGVSELEFIGHTADVKAAAFSPDGRYAVTGSVDGTARLWDARTGECFNVFEGHTAPITVVNFSPDGARVLTASEDTTLRLWDGYTGGRLRTFEGHQARINSALFLQDGIHIVSAGGDRAIRIWDAKSGLGIHVLEGHLGPVNQLSLAPDGKSLLSASDDKTLRQWNVAAARLDKTIRFAARVETVSISPDGSLIVVAHPSPDVGGAKSVCLMEFPKAEYYRVPYVVTMPISTAVAEERESSFVELLEKARAELENQDYRATLNSVKKAREISGYARDGEALLIWSELTARFPSLWLNTAWELETLQGHQSGVNAIAVHPDGGAVLAGDASGVLRWWDLSRGKNIFTILAHEGAVNAVTLYARGRTALSGGEDAIVRVWDIQSQQCVRALLGHTAEITSLAVSPDGRYALSGGLDGTLRLWDLISYVAMRQLVGHKDHVTSICFSPDGSKAATGSLDGDIRVWDLQKGVTSRVLEGHTRPVTDVAISPDGRFLLSASEDGTLRRWELLTEVHHETFRGHSSAVLAVAFCPDGRYALSGGADRTLRLWEMKTGDCLRVFEGHAAAVTSVVFNPDRELIASTGRDRLIRLWHLDWQPDIRDLDLWDDGAEPYLKNFITLHTPFSAGSLMRKGQPRWDDEDFDLLMTELSRRGFGWLLERGVKHELKHMAHQRLSLLETYQYWRDMMSQLNLRNLLKRLLKKALRIVFKLTPAALWAFFLVQNDYIGMHWSLAWLTVVTLALIMFAKRR
jgi:WD40 repeat protein/serine/threonine protein kinase